MFLLIGIIETYNLRPIYQERKTLKEDIPKEKNYIAYNNENITNNSYLSKPKKNPYIAGFSFIFLMELGDKTQILTITLASIYNNPLEVW